MTNNNKKRKINKLISDIERAEKYLKKYKTKTVEWANNLGINEELAEAGKNLWRNYTDYKNLPDTILDSIGRSAYDLADKLEKSEEMFLNNNIDDVISATTTASVAVCGASASAMAVPINSISSQDRDKLNKIMEGLNQQEEVSQRLGIIDSSLKDEYDNAWKNLRTSVKDITRSSMFLMREVFRRILEHFSPDEEVRKFNNLQPKDTIKARHRRYYIINKLESWDKNAFINQTSLLKKTYRLLSKEAHKPKQLDVERTKGYLYSTSALIKFLLDHLG